jgi:hypothetical protein
VLVAAYGPGHAESANALAVRGRSLRAAGRVELADSLAREALDLLDATVGPTHPLTVAERWRLAVGLNEEARYADALVELERAHAGVVDVSTPTGVSLFRSVRLEMARSQLGLGNPRAADSLLTIVERSGDDRLTRPQRESLAALRARVPPAGR